MSSREFDRESSIVYRGDFRLRLRYATWKWAGRGGEVWKWAGPGGRVWEITFDRGFIVSTAHHRRFTVAVIKAVWGVYFPPKRAPREAVEDKEE